MRTFKVGLVGTGGIAHAHMAGYRTVLGDRVDVVAACDPRPDVLQEFGEQYKIKHRYPDADSMLTDVELDIIVMLTPPQVRDEVLEPAFSNGVNVLVEKPFAEDFERARRYVQEAKDSGVALAVGQNFRWFPEYQWLNGRAHDAGMGQVDFIEHRCFQNRPQTPGVWRAQQQRLEMAIYSIHMIDRIQWVAGSRPTTVSAVTRQRRGSGLPGEQFTALTAQFDDGLVAQMTSSWLAKTLPTNEMRVDAEIGSVTVQRRGPMQHDAAGHWRLEDGTSEEVRFPDDQEVGHGARTYGHSLKEFVSAIDEGREARHSGFNNLRTMAMMDAAYLSASRGGQMVEISEVAGDAKLDVGETSA